MSAHLQYEIEKLKKKVISLGVDVEENLHKAVLSLETRDLKLGEIMIGADRTIDLREVDLEEECLKILALHQPVAIDLRFVIAVLKINNELERIGDLAVNIAERSVFISSQPPVDTPFDFTGMADKTKTMLRNSLESLVNMDSKLARQVCKDDDEVDAINREMYGQVQDGIREDIEKMECLIHYLGASRHLERIADMATNIAEDVIYMVDGEIIRHKTEDLRKAAEA
jgi:phosphate transport system protein